MEIFTLGHSNHPFARFSGLLAQHGITVVADVRSVPYSRRYPQYRREDLAAGLRAAGIDYVFLGSELGARSDDPGVYADGRVQFDRLARTALFRSGIERLCALAVRQRVAIMCAEREPLDCHRTVLVARALEREGVVITHILGDGSLESNGEAMQRLVRDSGLGADLFSSGADLVEEACRRREERIAWRLPDSG